MAAQSDSRGRLAGARRRSALRGQTMRRIWAILVVGALLGIGCGSGAAPSDRSPGGAPSGSAGSAASSPAAGGGSAAPQALIPVKASFSAFAMSQSPIEIAKEGGYFA